MSVQWFVLFDYFFSFYAVDFSLLSSGRPIWMQFN